MNKYHYIYYANFRFKMMFSASLKLLNIKIVVNKIHTYLIYSMSNHPYNSMNTLNNDSKDSKF